MTGRYNLLISAVSGRTGNGSVYRLSIVEEVKTIEKLSWHQKLLLKKELKNKCHSFHQQGYTSVTESELIDYLICYRWKKQKMDSIKACREDILHIEANEFFDYQQLVAQTSSHTIKDWHDIEDLF